MIDIASQPADSTWLEHFFTTMEAAFLVSASALVMRQLDLIITQFQ